MKRMMTIVFLLIVAVGNYIPVKFAVKSTDNTNALYCKTEPKISSGYKWISYAESNSSLDYNLFFELEGKNPNNYLSGLYFDVNSWHKVGHSFPNFGLDNTFIIYFNSSIDKVAVDHILYADNWDIAYPIKRAGLRRYLTPKAYLSVYDFDWFGIIKRCFIY